MSESFVTIEPVSGNGPMQLRIVAEPHTGRLGRDIVFKAHSESANIDSSNNLLIHQKGVLIMHTDLSQFKDAEATETSGTYPILTNYEYLKVRIISPDLQLTGAIIAGVSLNSASLAALVNDSSSSLGYRVVGLNGYDPGAKKHYSALLSFSFPENEDTTEKMYDFQVNNIPHIFYQKAAEESGGEVTPVVDTVPEPVPAFVDNVLSFSCEDQDATIRYRKLANAEDEDDPSDTWFVYDGIGIQISSETQGTYRAYASKEGWESSDTVDIVCTYEEDATPGGGGEGGDDEGGEGTSTAENSVAFSSNISGDTNTLGNITVTLTPEGAYERDADRELKIDVRLDNEDYDWTIDCVAIE